MRDIGDEVAHSIREYFAEPRQSQGGCTPRRQAENHADQPAPVEGRGALRDKRFRADRDTRIDVREEAEQKILAAGGRVTSAVSRKTDYVVAGADPRLEAAQSAGTWASRCWTRTRLESAVAGSVDDSMARQSARGCTWSSAGECRGSCFRFAAYDEAQGART